MLRAYVTLIIAALRIPAPAPSPNGPLDYTITVDSTRLNEYSVTLRTTSQGDPVTLVMARHPEYDDRFFPTRTRRHTQPHGARPLRTSRCAASRAGTSSRVTSSSSLIPRS